MLLLMLLIFAAAPICDVQLECRDQGSRLVPMPLPTLLLLLLLRLLLTLMLLLMLLNLAAAICYVQLECRDRGGHRRRVRQLPVQQVRGRFGEVVEPVVGCCGKCWAVVGSCVAGVGLGGDPSLCVRVGVW
jgi:hypothetical protein